VEARPEEGAMMEVVVVSIPLVSEVVVIVAEGRRQVEEAQPRMPLNRKR
jgi:hypothetical protein